VVGPVPRLAVDDVAAGVDPLAGQHLGRVLEHLAGAVVHAVVAVELLLVLRRQVAVLGDLRSVLDRGLVVGQGDPVTGDLGARHRHEALMGAEQTGVDRDPRRLVDGVVVVDLTDLADLVPITVVRGGPDHLAQLVLSDHQMCLLIWTVRRRTPFVSALALPGKAYPVRPR
jgi:hypothetical protein